MRALLLFLALLQPASPAYFSAKWNSATSAIVQWQQPTGVHETCLYRYYGAEWPAAICWRNLPPGEQVVDLPGALSHLAYVPANGDHYTLWMDGAVVGNATLGEVKVYRVYLGAMAKQTPAMQRVFVPWALAKNGP